MKVESLFDGWTTQIVDKLVDSHGGYCATGWIAKYSASSWTNQNETIRRVGEWIQKNMNPPEVYQHRSGPKLSTKNHYSVIVWANNERLLTPDDFRRIDRCTQLAELRVQAENDAA